MSDNDPQQDAAFEPPSLQELAALLPQFEMQDFLAQGGMGAVYLARQISLDRLVAIKVLPPAWGAEAGYAQKFQTEARAMAKLHHNHIVGVFDFGLTTAGHLYLVMEYVRGQTLHEMIRLKRLALPKVQGLALQLCDGLAYAHENGVLHRDIKPGNVLVSNSGEVKIADFGLARHAGAAVEDDALGTPDYAAPELFERGALVDHRADIYALGIVFQEMLSGRVPGRPREPLSTYGAFDPGWEPLIAKATHHSPAARFRTVRELRDAVANVAKRAAPPSAVPARAAYRRPSSPTREVESSSFPWTSVLAGLVVAGVAVTWWWRNRSELPESNRGSAAVAASTSAAGTSSTTSGSSTATPPSGTTNAGTATAPVSTEFSPGAPFKLDPMPPGHVFKLTEGHKDVIYDVAVFPDQRHAATGGADGTVGVWDLQTGTRIRTFGPVSGNVPRVVVSPDGRWVATGGSEYKVHVWSMDGASGSPPKELALSSRYIPHLAFTDDGSTLLIGTTDASQPLVVWDWQKSATPEVVPGIRTPVSAMDRATGLQPNGFVVTGQRSESGQFVYETWLVDVTRRSLVRQLASLPVYVSRMKVTPDGRHAVGLLAGRIGTWDLEGGGIMARSEAATVTVGEFELLDSGRLVLFGGQDRCLHLMEAVTGKDVWTSAPMDTNCTNTVEVLAAGRYAVSGGGYRTGNPMQKDGDYALHTWVLPDFASLKSGDAERATLAQQMRVLDKSDPELWALLNKLAAEWTEKLSAGSQGARKDLDEKYLGAVRREMTSASPREREAFLTEISRVTNGGAGTLPIGSPPPLVRLHEIYQQQVALLPQKAASTRSELVASNQAQLEALEKKRIGASDVPGAARVKAVMQALFQINGEMVIAKIQGHFQPKAPTPPVAVPPVPARTAAPNTSVATGLLTTPPPRATGDIPPYTAPLRGLVRPMTHHRVEAWLRNTTMTTSQTGLSKIPADLGPVVALAVGWRHALALKPDGTVVQWGHEDSRVLDVPEGLNRIVAIDAGSTVSACLRDDGVVIAWNTRQILAQRSDRRPAVGVSATYSFALARHEDGSVSYMGTSPTVNNSSYTPPPDLKGCIQVSAASSCAIGLKSNGTVVGWGRSSQANIFNMTDNMPQRDLVDAISIAANSDLAFLLKRSGELIAWGQRVPEELAQRPRFPGATRILPGRPSTGLAIGFQPGIWKFLSLSDNRVPIDVETAERRARGCTEVGIGQFFILGMRPM